VTDAVDHEVRQDVTDVLVRYATGIDSRDWELFRSCFTEDCDVEYPEIGVWHTADEITEWMRNVHDPCGYTLHRITNQVVTPRDGGVTARSYVDGIVMFSDNKTGTRATGFYDDELIDTAEGWKIARRRFTLVLLQLFPEGTSLDLGA
jgi:3-phenylpropionate/cinnamic acid dioxygenase small subunit